MSRRAGAPVDAFDSDAARLRAAKDARQAMAAERLLGALRDLLAYCNYPSAWTDQEWDEARQRATNAITAAEEAGVLG